jgi:hypothetical protein
MRPRRERSQFPENAAPSLPAGRILPPAAIIPLIGAGTSSNKRPQLNALAVNDLGSRRMENVKSALMTSEGSLPALFPPQH